jgi:hypothetical protein
MHWIWQKESDAMPKCIVCQQNSPIVQHLWRNTPESVVKVADQVDPIRKWLIDDGHSLICQDAYIPMICELCWYGLIGSGGEYVWNGLELMVWDTSEQEYIEPSGHVYKPYSVMAIQFERCGYRHEWVAMPRSRGKED